MSLRINSDFNGVTDPDAGAYIAAVEAADGQLLEFAVGKAINDFVVGCKQDRIWNAIKASCILAGARTLAGALQPLAGTAPTNNNFVSGDYNRKTGLVGDGSTKYLNSNRNNNADPQDSKHIAVWRSVAASDNGGLLGSGNGAGHSQLYTGFSQFITRNNASTASTQGIGVSPAITFYGTSRAFSSVFTVRHGNANYTSTVTSQTPANASLMVFDDTTDPTNARLAFYSIGESLDLALLDARVSALITAFGVSIP